ncbi:NAD(P)H-dependent oxidoreductase [Campylobacter fetus]|uniref:NAD(P)H-dependent oxidoreductase n=1 Tax=Campylobacter fetus TaxID=196 RepID=UPI0003C2A621|nr:NAD(P)H-dependent oxidoreductase [Campylobacter fetus]AGZ81237.1 nitroreductase [Campylobacter fetus subsp. testudinum 03-427]AJB44992.1 nitroreductase [Campylobacter fetus subsp. testudinum]AVK80617.1 NAD(P)H-dependent oxidoreductase [Campylobacter fetus subsp. testudinum]EAI4321637.1 NAD(P)H-dependent oxidoreductase [Campylobacter fetus]EAI4391491.1 NAD(P)H-dependent oxidoreductase [Campylobacter fetus]
MNVKEALNFRHACKIFDENRKIDSADFDDILEAGRLSPSSMGMQPWEFEVIEDKKLLEEMRKACWGQVQITTASKVVVIYAKIDDLRASSNYAKSIICGRKDKSEEEQKAYLQRYANMLKDNEGTSDKDIFSWARAQCYLAAQNMMMQAAFLGIDSCPMEGFVRDELESVLSIDTKQKRVALVLTFGYRKNPASKKQRRDIKDIVKYR